MIMLTQANFLLSSRIVVVLSALKSDVYVKLGTQAKCSAYEYDQA